MAEKIRLNCPYGLSILGKNSLIYKKCAIVLNFTKTRLKLFLILEKKKLRLMLLKKLFIKEKRAYRGAK